VAAQPPKYFAPRYFAAGYWGTAANDNPGAMVGSAAGTSTATGRLTGIFIAPETDRVPAGGATGRRRRTKESPAPIWRGGIVEIRADIVGSCVVSAEVVRHVPPADVAHVELEDDDLEVMAFVTAFLAKIANVERINGLSV
jgi:hypothetical protein